MTKVRILLYHGVISDHLESDGRNSSGKHISISKFEDQMKFVSKNYNLISMQEINDFYAGKQKILQDSLAITFDDGFYNNFSNAWKILEKYNVPATIYLSSGFLSSKKRIWTDKLEIIFLDPKINFVKINGSKKIEFNSLEDRIIELTKLKKKLKKIKYSNLIKFIKEVTKLNIVNMNILPELYDFMTWECVKEMNKSNLISFGAHTIDHTSLSKIDFNEAKRQILVSLNEVSSVLGERIKLFSYPEGQIDDFNEKIVKFLKSINLNHCPTAISGNNYLNESDPFYLKRYFVNGHNNLLELLS